MRRFGSTTALIGALALLAACSSGSSDINPALCKSVLDQGGSAADYGRCMLGQGQGKSVGGMPVLNRSAQLFLRKKEDDACLAAGQTSTDYLACQFALEPAPAGKPGRTSIDSLPLVIVDPN